jgi:hypothetical protein
MDPEKPIVNLPSNFGNSFLPSTPSFEGFDQRFITQIADQLFYIETWMYNGLENFKPFAVPMFSIEGLAIEENLDDWNTKGWIILSNDFEMLERGLPPAKDRSKVDAPFLFRTDGRNKISIKIYPLSKEELPKKEWEMCYDFVIYDIEDLKTDSSANKLRKFYFWDERYQNLLERNIEWSTGLYGPNNGNVLGNDFQRAMPCSEAIKSIIKTASSNNSEPNSSDVTIGIIKRENTTLDLNSTPLDFRIPNENIQQRMDLFDEENWDRGFSGEEGLILYTSPSNSCALDDINYAYSLFKAEDGSPAFLRLDRYDRPEGKKFSLVSLKKYIENAEDSQIERIVIQDNQDPYGAPPYMNRAPFSDSSLIKNFQSGVASKITNYKFSPMVSVDDLNITNKPTHNYDFANGQFNVNFTSNSAENFLKKMKETVQDGLYSFKNKSQGGDAQLLFNINKTKQSGLMVINSLIPQTFYPKDLSYISMAKDFVFLNQALYFKSPGLTLRSPGKFIFVDRDVSTEDKNPFDDRFLGQWMINKVVHFFTRDTYTTDVICTKIDLFNKWFDENDENF